ncbi:3-phosphoserine/phosphohydroxythreonine transaminase [Oleiagrimonas soli]|uniref:Phosphoserine aminotransferase n=1 Tax=Oleiagrimonas soli TaxID=1543381 RepID=A0A099CXE6_9GAMM|nr:3-phosphoserine/phosphohydroxythreonine transaminase [Oleiagrimonas soli]KGI78341.1 MFS transporter [Oleiagrimonas soli]MBB6183160.1 phosphoserine aminotransferase [Oleiagrimonas soli]
MTHPARPWNFSAGPAALAPEVLAQAQRELLDWRGTGVSVMEVSHRGRDFMAMAEETEQDLRALMGIPDSYTVLFLQGGATQHFAQLAMNLAGPEDRADYVVTGHWSQKAVQEAMPYVNARVAASTEADGFRSVPTQFEVDPQAAYLHFTPNETIHGTEFHHLPESGDVPLVADMSSDILSRPLDVSKFGMIYAGAQKNIGPSGLVLLIVRDDLLRRPGRPMADIFRYARHAERDSMLNTPNTWGWYLAGLTFQWIAAQGGLEAIGARNQAKADALYAAIDGSGGFYTNTIDPTARSRMNVPFRLHDEALDATFLQASAEAGLMALKGHRALGGMRASIYNAMPMQGVQALIDFMGDFARRHG